MASFLAAGCGTVKPASREATQGGIEALRESNDPLVRDMRKLLELYTGKMLREGMPQIAEEAGRGFAAGAIKAFGDELQKPEQQAELAKIRTAIRLAGADMARGFIDGLVSRRGQIDLLLASIIEQAAPAMVRAISSEVAREWTSNDGTQVVTNAFPLIAQNAGASFVRGATAEIAQTFDRCGDPKVPCSENVVRRLSRVAAVGATEGVARPSATWPLGISFALGALVILAVDGARRLIRRRRSGRTVKVVDKTIVPD